MDNFASFRSEAQGNVGVPSRRVSVIERRTCLVLRDITAEVYLTGNGQMLYISSYLPDRRSIAEVPFKMFFSSSIIAKIFGMPEE